MNKFTAHRHKSSFSCTNNQNKQMEWGNLKDFHATHNWTVKHVEFNNIFWVQSNFIAINQTDYQMKWTQAIWNDVEMDTPPQNNVSNAQIMLNWSFRRQSTHIFIDRSFLYRTNKPQHCIYIIWIWQFPNQSTINQWFSLKKGWWQRSHEKDVKICSTISSYYLMCNLILLLRKKRLNWITFRIDLNPIHTMADKQSTTTARRRSSSSSTHLITNNE